MTDNRRTSTRYDVWIEAKMTVNGNPVDVTMTNLSLGGALVAGDKQTLGQHVKLS